MEPTLVPRDYVLTVSPRIATPAIGSIIVFRPDFNATALPSFIHRIVGRYPNGGWQTQGDNAQAADPWRVTNAQIVGVSTGIRLPSRLTQQPITFGSAIFLLCLLALWPGRQGRRERDTPIDNE